MRPEDNESSFFEAYDEDRRAALEDDDAPFDHEAATASLEAIGAAWLRLAPTIYGSAIQIHAISGDLKLGDTVTWESKPEPWSIWRFWRKAKPAQLNTFVVTSVQ